MCNWPHILQSSDIYYLLLINAHTHTHTHTHTRVYVCVCMMSQKCWAPRDAVEEIPYVGNFCGAKFSWIMNKLLLHGQKFMVHTGKNYNFKKMATSFEFEAMI